MKKVMFLVACLILVFSMSSLAADLASDDIDVSVTINDYAEVQSQRLRLALFERPIWQPWLEADVLMDFEHYSGKAQQSKLTDSNFFVVETNSNLTLTFHGERLTHENTEDMMLTTYWAFASAGYDEDLKMVAKPQQLVPKVPIGFFGEGPVPHLTWDFEVTDLVSALLAVKGVTEAREIWPKQGDVTQNRTYDITTGEGIYAFQVFGFAGTDKISSQPAGKYSATITLTVAKLSD